MAGSWTEPDASSACRGRVHYYRIPFCEALKIGLGGGHIKKPPRLMPSINRGGHFLLTEVVKKIASQNRLTEAVTLQWSASVNRLGSDKAHMSPIIEKEYIMNKTEGLYK